MPALFFFLSHIFLRLLLLSALLSFSLLAQASTPAAGLAVGDIVKVLLSLVLVLVAIFLAAFYIRRMQSFSLQGQGQMRVLASLALGPRERIVLVEVGSEQLLLGVSGNSVNLVKAIDEPIDFNHSSGQPSAFAEQLGKLLKRQ